MRKFFLPLLLFITTFIGYIDASTPQVIVFDFGGVMVKTDKTLFYEFIKQSFGLSDEALLDVRERFQIARTVKFPDSMFWRQLAEETHVTLDESWEDQYDMIIHRSIYEIPGMRDLIKFYSQQGIRIALLSNVQARHASFLSSRGYYEGFSPILLSCDIGVSKPDPKAYQILLHQLNVEPQSCIFIDDKQENINAAKALGIDAIVFLSHAQIQEELARRFNR